VDLDSDLLVFLAVLTLRFIVPLWVFQFPLPAILTALVLDGIDQTIFQNWTDLDLTNYQGYDKALDVYYLTIAYISTLRNWDNLFAFRASRFLLYYRLVGVMLFEFTQVRAVLLIFPNTFEYFFIFYEGIRLRWDPARMGRKLVISSVAFIWIVIKLPQEYWIHIAQRDFTDTVEANPILIPILVALALVVLVGGWWIVTQRCPPADRRPSFAVDAPFAGRDSVEELNVLRSRNVFDAALGEKVAMVSLVIVIFSQILPEVDASALQLAVGVGILILTNTVVSEWLARRGVNWLTVARQFIAMAAINGALAVLFAIILPIGDGSIHLGNSLFFLLLVSLLITLYDRYRPYYLWRLASAPS
jgi:hypothetical protein